MIHQDRVHACLDGELDAASLTPSERARLEALRAASDEVASVLRSVVAPDLTARVMGALPPELAQTPSPERRGVWRRVASAWWDPRSVTIRPAYALAAAASIAFASFMVPQMLEQEDLQPQVLQVGESATVYVQFRLERAEADEVRLAGSFNGWQPTYELSESAPGTWTVMIPLDPGVHDYTFVVDGEEWILDPAAPRVADSFGGSNSRLFLPSPEGAV